MNELIRMCLHFGVSIPTFQQKAVLELYERYKVPDEVLIKFNLEEMQTYVRGLSLFSQEGANSWDGGIHLLEALGFETVERRDGHRVFVSLKWKGIKEGK